VTERDVTLEKGSVVEARVTRRMSASPFAVAVLE
jgi:hypothetical protein